MEETHNLKVYRIRDVLVIRGSPLPERVFIETLEDAELVSKMLDEFIKEKRNGA